MQHQKSLNYFLFYLLTSFLVLFNYGCSKKDSPASAVSLNSQGLSEVANLPKSTAPVISQSSLSRSKNSQGNFFTRAAANGVTFAQSSGLSWTSEQSRPFCESLAVVKDIYSEAATPDKILCYIGVMKTANAFTGTLDDGNYKYYSIGEGEETGHVKFKIVKNSNNLITQFEMFSCMGGQSGVQDTYINQLVAGGNVTATTKNVGGGDGGSTWGGSVTATGAINASGAWTSKSISATRQFGNSDSNFGQQASIIQESDKIKLSGFMSGMYAIGEYSQTFSNSYFSIMQLLNPSSMSTFALGDGSSKYSINFTSTSFGSYSPGVLVKSWNGDSRANLDNASDGDFYEEANAGTLPTVSSISEITFSSSEAWDCKDPNGGEEGFTAAQITSSINEAFEECNTKYEADRNWVSCYESE